MHSILRRLYAIIVIAVAILANAATSSLGRYDNQDPAFYLGHFDRSPDTDPEAFAFRGQVYRGGQPKLDSNQWVERFSNEQIDLVVDLRAEARSLRSEREALRRVGIDYVLLPWKTSGTDQDSVLEVSEVLNGSERKWKLDRVEATLHVLALVKSYLQRGQKVYIHCQRGEDRTGTFASLLRHPGPQWRREFTRYGGSEYAPLKKHRADVIKAF
ncbi:MAG TPA: tyrosine-protein phosphatase [Bdellovibrionota bacterium]|jgi:protein tyrosine/serine phosphatase|nr:tyrosine-protein phosphatase [Bdellovibrionota bacterium]